MEFSSPDKSAYMRTLLFDSDEPNVDVAADVRDADLNDGLDLYETGKR